MWLSSFLWYLILNLFSNTSPDENIRAKIFNRKDKEGNNVWTKQLKLEPSYLGLNHLPHSSFNIILTESFKKILSTLKVFSNISSFKYSKHIFATILQNTVINSFKLSVSTIWPLWLLLFYLSTCFNRFSFDHLVFDSVFLAENSGYLVFSPHWCYPQQALEPVPPSGEMENAWASFVWGNNFRWFFLRRKGDSSSSEGDCSLYRWMILRRYFLLTE